MPIPDDPAMTRLINMDVKSYTDRFTDCVKRGISTILDKDGKIIPPVQVIKPVVIKFPKKRKDGVPIPSIAKSGTVGWKIGSRSVVGSKSNFNRGKQDV